MGVHELPVKVTAELIASAPEDDPLVAEARALANEAIRAARHMIRHGSPANKLKVIAALMPAIGRGLGQRSEAEEVAEMRRTLEGLTAAVLGDQRTG